MNWPFERGKIYHRRRDIHGRYGEQQQGGISTPVNAPVIVLITGGAGEQHGYSDRLRDDGVFEYFGEGQLGDMQMRGGNLAISKHSMLGKSLLLFTKQKGGNVRFEGEWACAGIQNRQAPDKQNNERQTIVFELELLETINQKVDDSDSVSERPLDKLRQDAIAAAQDVVPGRPSKGTIFQRSSAVRRYVLARAGINCEGCMTVAPFTREDGSPYLEPHHIRRVSDGGPDDPRWVIALCPNCHRRAHHSRDRLNFNQSLQTKLGQIEPL